MKISSVALWQSLIAAVVVDLTLATAPSAADSATSPDTADDVGCAAAAREYQYYGDINGLPPSLIEGKPAYSVIGE